MAAASDAMERAFGKRPVFQREGGSIPVVAWFKQALGIDTVLLGFGLPDDRIHAPNEKADVEFLMRGAEAAAYMWADLAATWGR